MEARGEPEKGADLLKAFASRSLPAAMERARLLEVIGRRDEAGEIAAGIVRGYRAAGAYTSREKVAIGDAARARGDFQGAARMYELAYTDSVGYVEARVRLMLLFRDKSQSQLAGDELVVLGNIAPRHPDVLLAAARLAALGTDLARAEGAARAVLAVRPEDPGATSVLARVAMISSAPAGCLDAVAPASGAQPHGPRSQGVPRGGLLCDRGLLRLPSRGESPARPGSRLPGRVPRSGAHPRAVEAQRRSGPPSTGACWCTIRKAGIR